LERIGGFDLSGVQFHPNIGMAEPWRYRNKTQVPIGEEEGGLIGGFYRDRSHDIIDMKQCLIQHELHDKVVQAAKELGTRLGIPAYNEIEHKGFLRHVVAKYGFETDQLMIVLVTNGEEFPAKKALITALRDRFSNLKSIVQNINTKRTNVILGDRSKVLWGEPYIYDTIGQIRFAISARSFFQVNPVQTKVLYETALKFASLKGEETVIDAYSGIGTISLVLAQKAKQVLGVEVVAEAVEDAWRNAKLNGITNVRFETGKAEEVLPRWKEEGIQADVIVVDPPRKGCDQTLLSTILEMQPIRVVYVSCNPSTLARDLKILAEGGYQLLQVQPVDMFPQTAHVECVTLMSKVEK
jgi:23S rRNA (uracil1939-C5)-methyltransferase